MAPPPIPTQPQSSHKTQCRSHFLFDLSVLHISISLHSRYPAILAAVPCPFGPGRTYGTPVATQPEQRHSFKRLGFWGLVVWGFRVWVLGVWCLGLGFRLYGLRFMGLGLTLLKKGLGFRVSTGNYRWYVGAYMISGNTKFRV